jgi:hypothetical protein
MMDDLKNVVFFIIRTPFDHEYFEERLFEH